jgi:DNA-binding CsgD family transcriptional regulator
VRDSHSRVRPAPDSASVPARVRSAQEAPAGRPFAASPVGVLLLDGGLNPVYYNAAAASILGYPDAVFSASSVGTVLPASQPPFARTARCSSAIEFASGRRRYMSRTFLLESNGNPRSAFQPRLLVVLERECAQQVDITRWSEEFQLTCRERETVRFLLKGLTSKEIAAEMDISPNTVKSFLKTVMAKVGAPTRTAIIGKILERTAETSVRPMASTDS